MRCDEATSTAGSPGPPGGLPLTGDVLAGHLPADVSMTSRTENPAPSPRLKILVLRRVGIPSRAQQVGVGQVGNVDVVAQAGAVGGGVVVAEDPR